MSSIFHYYNYISTGFRKNVEKFCSQLDINIQDRKHLFAPFIHESYLLANTGNLSGSFECNEKLAFLGKVVKFCWLISLDIESSVQKGQNYITVLVGYEG